MGSLLIPVKAITKHTIIAKIHWFKAVKGARQQCKAYAKSTLI
jgi:hypothetical protein